MADIKKIAEDLSSLTVLEAADLAKLLEEKWGVSASAPVAVAASSGEATPATEANDDQCGRFTILWAGKYSYCRSRAIYE